MDPRPFGRQPRARLAAAGGGPPAQAAQQQAPGLVQLRRQRGAALMRLQPGPGSSSPLGQR